MFTHRQRSFVADVRPLSGALQFRSIIDSSTSDRAHLIAYTFEARKDAIRLYFRYTSRGYRLYVQEGLYLGHAIRNDSAARYGAYPLSVPNSSYFWLKDEINNPITGTELTYTDTTVSLTDNHHHPLVVTHYPLISENYLASSLQQEVFPLRISLIERNADYPEYAQYDNPKYSVYG